MTVAMRLLRWVVLLVVVSAAAALLQWLAAPEGYGASFRGFRGGAAVRPVAELLEPLNAPRDRLLKDLRLAYTPSRYFYTGSHHAPADDWYGVGLFTAGSVVFYLPLAIGIALLRSGPWSAVRRPVLIAAALFAVAAVACFAFVSSALILTALTLGVAAIGIAWTPVLTRRSRAAALATLLAVAVLIRTQAITRSSGPGDAWSHAVFFFESVVLFAVPTGVFLSVVALLVRVAAARRR
jgi:hypothetical protein